MPKPEGYPLPWCEAFDAPYFAINLMLCDDDEWRKWQAYKPMSVIIPRIDQMIAEGKIPKEIRCRFLMRTS